MKLKLLIVIVNLFLLSDLSFSQTDSLIGQEVTIHFHKTKKTVTGKFRSYKDNRVTVLFDKSLHDYLYPEIKFLEFRGLNFKFNQTGDLIEKTIEYRISTKHGRYEGSILKESDTEILIQTKSVGKVYIQKENIKTMKKVN